MRTNGWMALGGLTILLAATGGHEARAQAAQSGLGPDSFLVVVPVRDTFSIRRDIDLALQTKTQSQSDRAVAEALRNSARARIVRKEGEIDVLNERIKAAKSEGRPAAVAALEADKRGAQREKGLLERREALRETEIDLEKRRGELADARRDALELELQLAVRRMEAQVDTLTGPARTRVLQVVSDLEMRTLEAQQLEAEKFSGVADHQKEIIKRRMEILQAQRGMIVADR